MFVLRMMKILTPIMNEFKDIVKGISSLFCSFVGITVYLVPFQLHRINKNGDLSFPERIHICFVHTNGVDRTCTLASCLHYIEINTTCEERNATCI